MSGASAILLDLAGDEPDQRQLPERLCAQVARVLTSVDGASLALATDDLTLELLAASDDSTRELARHQLDLGDGPSLAAHRSGVTLHVPDLGVATSRWPVYAAAAERAGVHSSVSIPLRVGGIRMGVLDLLARRTGCLEGLEGAELGEALDYAEAAVLVVLHLHSSDHSDDQPGEAGPVAGSSPLSPLEQAFDARAEVHQATGMVAVQAEVGLAEALLLIRARAFSEDRSMMDVALDVVTRRLRFG